LLHARQKLTELESQQGTAKVIPERKQVDLFTVEAPASPALDVLKGIDPDQMTPKDALDALYTLKTLLDT
jgi:DNA mismatch repair protein MutS